MPAERVGLLLDSLSQNTGYKAIRHVMEDFLTTESINYETVNPTSFDPKRYSRLIVGGGDLIQPPGNSFYDIFRQKGPHILNCVGLNSDLELDYLREYSYVSVRSEGDERILRQRGIDTQIVPSVSMILSGKRATLHIPSNTIGFHLHSVSYANVPDAHHIINQFPNYHAAFIPFTHYNNDAATMELVAARVPDSIFLGRYEPAELMWIVKQLKAFVCSSLHAAIFAYANNVPFLVFPYSMKIERFLEDRGLERLAFRNSTDLQRKLLEILTNPPDFSKMYEADVKRVRNHLDHVADALKDMSGEESVSSTFEAEPNSRYLQHVTKQKSADIHYLEVELAAIAEDNWRLRHSTSFKITDTSRRIVDKLFPQISRRDVSSILAASLTVLREQGPVMLARKLTQRISKRHIVKQVEYVISDREYGEWICENEPKADDLADQRKRSAELNYRPLMSILIPVWNPPEKVLKDTLHSVMEQTYPYWEMCITDGGSNERVRRQLHEAEVQDQRVRVKLLNKNLGISYNSNTSLEICSGEFIVLLDHDDELSPSALYEVAKVLNDKPDLDFIYSDKDKITQNGKRFGPLFKPDWSPDVMLSANYVTHLCAMRTDLVRRVGGFRSETDGAQDWDLFLRIFETTQKIHHIPKVLYHWRVTPHSVASRGLDAKPYAAKAQLITLNEHMMRTRTSGKIYFNGQDQPRICWDNSAKPLVSIATFYRSAAEITRLLSSVYSKTTYDRFEVIIVCTGSDASHVSAQFPGVKIQESNYSTYPQAYNIGAKLSSGEVIIFLDPAIDILESGWLSEMVGWAMRPQVGAVGAQLLSTTSEIFHQGIVVGLSGFMFQGIREVALTPFGHTEWYRDCTAVTGACLAMRRAVFTDLGRFSEESTMPDVDLCLKARERGYRVVCTPGAKLRLNPSEGSRWSTEILSHSRKLHSEHDPYFNPNLSYNHTIPRLSINAAEPRWRE